MNNDAMLKIHVKIFKLHAIESQEHHFAWEKKNLPPPGRPHQAYTHGSPYVCMYVYIYIENIYIDIRCTKRNISIIQRIEKVGLT